MKSIVDNLLQNYNHIVIYGAGGVAKDICKLIKEYVQEKTVSIAVTDCENNPAFLDDYPVYSINEVQNTFDKMQVFFIVAMMPESASKVKQNLIRMGYAWVITAEELVKQMYVKFYQNPVQKGKIVFSNFSGRGYGCNPKSICEELLKRGTDDLDCVWAAENVDSDFPETVRVIAYGTEQYYYELATAQIWIDNQHKNFLSQKREGQYFVQTWHGCGPLKKIEYDAPDLPRSYLELLDYNMKMVDLCLSGAEFCTQQYRRAFRYKGDIFEYGCPRNDVFFKTKMDHSKVREKFSIASQTKVILYAPTLREGESNKIDAQLILTACETLYANPCILLIREHPKMAMQAGRYCFSKKIINASDYPDVQEILAVSDMLITDYSSIMWDFSLQKKPVFLYHPDAMDYEEERGFYLPFSAMPYIEAFDNHDLYFKICNYQDESYQQNLNEFFKRYKPFDQGRASVEVVNKLLEVIENAKKTGNAKK